MACQLCLMLTAWQRHKTPPTIVAMATSIIVNINTEVRMSPEALSAAQIISLQAQLTKHLLQYASQQTLDYDIKATPFLVKHKHSR